MWYKNGFAVGPMKVALEQIPNWSSCSMGWMYLLIITSACDGWSCK